MNVIQVEVWQVAAGAISVAGVFAVVAWRFAVISAKLAAKIVIDGVYTKMDICESGLLKEIEINKTCINNCCARVETVEYTLMNNGVSLIKVKK